MRSGSSSSSSRFKIRPQQVNASTCDFARFCLQSGDNTGTHLHVSSATLIATHRRRNSTARLDTGQSGEKIMNQALQDAIEHRRTTNIFEPNHTISDEQIKHLVHLATRAPSSFNLQNWRFLAVRTPERKAKLRKLAYDQAKVSEAAVTFIVCGQLADYSALGFMSPELVAGWVGAAKGLYDDKPQ